MTRNQIEVINSGRNQNRKIRVISAMSRLAAGSLVMLYKTKYDNLNQLNRHTEIAHTDKEGLWSHQKLSQSS